MREVRVSDDRTEVCLSPAAYRAALALLRWTHEDVAVRVMQLAARPLGPCDLRSYADQGTDLAPWVAGAALSVLLQFVEFTCANGEVGVVLKRGAGSGTVAEVVRGLARSIEDWGLKGMLVGWEPRCVR